MTEQRVADLIRNKKVLICCGAGGVGKTTTSTGIALAAAREGRRVLAVTIDPSKRLAETLGVERNLTKPTSVPQDRLDLASIKEPACLETWMLDPQLVANRVVERLSRTPEDAERLQNNRIYQGVSSMVAGMQEYTAMEALYSFIRSGEYDLIVLDTPPSRNALDFLDGPRRLARFFDKRIFSLFLPGEEEGFIRRAASQLIAKAMSSVFGEATFRDLQDFFSMFGSIFEQLNSNATDGRKLLSDPKDVGFLLISSPAPESLTDAFYFRKKTREMELPFTGFVLNRSEANPGQRVVPSEALLGDNPSEAALSGLKKLKALAELETAQVKRDQGLLDDLRKKAGDDAIAIALPNLPGGANDMASLIQIADALMAA